MSIFISIEEAIKELADGKMLVLVDNPDRENQGDLVFPAQTASKERINFLLTHCRGLICVALSRVQAVQLQLPLMVQTIDATEKTGVQFTVSVDAAAVSSFGISSADRALTARTLADPNAKPADLVRPGHLFPLLARDGGVLERTGHTEATVDLCRLAGFESAGVLCEILNDEGEPANGIELRAFSDHHSIKMVSVDDLVSYVRAQSLPAISAPRVVKTATATLPTTYGIFTLSVYVSYPDNREHIVLCMGDIKNAPALTRVHSQCVTGDTFFSQKCDCNAQLHASLRVIAEHGSGVLVYLNQEGRGIGLTNKIRAYALQEQGLDTVEANTALALPVDAREYAVAAEMLHKEGVEEIKLLTNSPDKVEQLSKEGIRVLEKVSLETLPTDFNKSYLQVKKHKLGHSFKNV